MGSVDLVYDAVRGESVARKRCLGSPRPGRSDAARAWTRLKQEFRAVAELRHPHLVPVYDLGEDQAGVFFTMRAVTGVDLLTWCRPGCHPAAVESSAPLATTVVADTWPGGVTSDVHELGRGPRASGESFVLDRLAKALPGLLEALAHLHARGLVHRDLKPSNILVEQDGTTVVVDFGILAELSAPGGEVVGTPTYMAPEQVHGAPPSVAMDLYSLGATLFEVITGAPPFVANTPQGVLMRHVLERPPLLTTVAPELPVALTSAVDALLAKPPETRPSLTDLAARVLPAIGGRAARLERTSIGHSELIGRGELLGAVAERLAAGPGFGAWIFEGMSGVGKTTLLRWAEDHVRARGGVVLHARARQNEMIPFNALDGIVDALARMLGQGELLAECSADLARAAKLFPVLDAKTPGTNSDNRGEAFGALVRVLSVVARDSGTLLLSIDDLQWADGDSMALLQHLCTMAPERVKLVATLRSDTPDAPAAQGCRRWRHCRTTEVLALDSSALAEIAIRASGGALSREQAETVGELCAGRAYLAEVAGRMAANAREADCGPMAALALTLGALPPTHRTLLGVLAATSSWITLSELARAMGVSFGRVDDAARDLASLAIVRRSGRSLSEGLLDLHHDMARDAVLESLGDDGVRRGHETLVNALLAQPNADALRLVRHLLGAGRAEEAASRAEIEADRATGRMAYALAADLWAVAERASAPARRAEARRHRATALVRAGRYADAVGVLGTNANASSAFDRAYALLMAGDIDGGVRALNRMLVQSGSRPLARGRLGTLLEATRFFIAGPPTPRAALHEPLDTTRAREDRSRNAEIALLLSWEDPTLAVSFAHRVRDRADAGGQPENGALSDYVLAFLAVAADAQRGEAALARRYLRAARARAAPLASEPQVSALDTAVTALEHMRRGEFVRAARDLEPVARQLEQSGHARTHTHLLILSNRCGALLSAERVFELGVAADEFEAACPDAQGAMEAHTLIHRVVHSFYCGDRVTHDAARRRLRERRRSEPAPRFHHLIQELFSGYADLFWGDPEQVYARLRQALREGAAFFPMRTYFAGALAAHLALAEAAALRSGSRDASGARVERWARRALDAPPFAASVALRAWAYAADALGQRHRALVLLRDAELTATRYDQRCSRAISRYQRGIRIGSAGGGRLVAQALEDLQYVGAARHVLEEDPGMR